MPDKKGGKNNVLKREIGFGRINLTAKAVFAKHMSVMQKSGLTIVDSLKIIMDSSQGRFQKVIGGVLKSVESGNTLSSSFARYPKVFTNIFISSVYAGESSGTLDQNLENLSVQLQKEKELGEKIKGAMLYPIVVLTAAFGLGLALSFFVLPKITPLFEGLQIELPVTTRILINTSHFINKYNMPLFLGIIGVILFLSWLLRQKFIKPFTHFLLLKIPIIKRVARNSNLARFSRTLGMLLKSGLSIDEALGVTKDTMSNYYYHKSLEDVYKRVGKGVKLSDNLKQYENLYPKMVSRMILVGEESGKLDETLLYLANFYEMEVDNSTKSLSTTIEPILLIVIGLAVGFLALSIITPIYNITGNIRR